MANEALVRKSTLAIKKELSFNADPVAESGNVIRVADFELDGEYDQESYTEISNTKDGTPELRGASKAPGNISINMRASGAEGTAPEGDVLYEGSFGTKKTSTADVVGASASTTAIPVADASHFHVNDVLACIIPTVTTFTVDTGSTTTTIELTSVTGLAVGDIVQVPNGDGTALIEAVEITGINATDKNITISPAVTTVPEVATTVKKASIEFTRVTALDTDTDVLTVSPALSAAPDRYTDLRSSVNYQFSLSDLPSFWIDLWRGDVVHEEYGGNKVDSLEINFETGKVIVPKFSFNGVSFNKETGSYGLGAPSFNDEVPVVAKNMRVLIGGSSHNCDKFSFKISNEIYDDKDLTTDGIGQKIHTARTVEGSFSELYRSLAIYTAFKNDTQSTAIIVCGRDGKVTAGNAIVLIVPAMRYIKTPITKDNNLFKYDVSYKAMNGLVGSEDAAVLAFL